MKKRLLITSFTALVVFAGLIKILTRPIDWDIWVDKG